jgi:FeS assembly protein IscX
MKLKWSSIYDIAIDLEEKFPDVDILSLSFVKLHKMIIELENFADDPESSSEGILESIQMAWLDERD